MKAIHYRFFQVLDNFFLTQSDKRGVITKGGSVIVRGRGIVASRIIQRISEIRRQNPNITILHLMRLPKPEGNKFGSAQRKTENQWEFQPYNWPKGTWGGDMKKRLEEGSPVERQRLLTDWGGTTTADRTDWKKIVSGGLQQGWYTIAFGKVDRVEQDDQGRLVTYLESSNIKGESKLNADFVIDSTGLDAKPSESPFLNDLVTHYSLPLNPLGRLHVANDFELVEMRNDRARMYAAGVMTLDGPYAPVDTIFRVAVRGAVCGRWFGKSARSKSQPPKWFGFFHSMD